MPSEGYPGFALASRRILLIFPRNNTASGREDRPRRGGRPTKKGPAEPVIAGHPAIVRRKDERASRLQPRRDLREDRLAVFVRRVIEPVEREYDQIVRGGGKAREVARVAALERRARMPLTAEVHH